LLRKQRKTLGGYFILPHPVDFLFSFIFFYSNSLLVYKLQFANIASTALSNK